MVTLTQLFVSKQGEMAAQFNTPLEHPVAKGDNFENAWTKFLRAYLPNRYECGKGFIVDSRNNVSDQIDVIIYDKYFSPFFLNIDSNKYIPAESVYAVFEVKPVLDKKNFVYAQNKAKSVRRLYRTSASVISNGNIVVGRKPFPIIAGLLTNTCRWERGLPKQILDEIEPGFLNLCGCVDGDSWAAKETESGLRYVKNNNRENSLLSFFMELLNQLQIRGTVTALDVPKYFDGFAEVAE